MINPNGENSSAMSTEMKEKDKTQEEETPVVEPIVNLIQQLEDYTPTVVMIYYSNFF